MKYFLRTIDTPGTEIGLSGQGPALHVQERLSRAQVGSQIYLARKFLLSSRMGRVGNVTCVVGSIATLIVITSCELVVGDFFAPSYEIRVTGDKDVQFIGEIAGDGNTFTIGNNATLSSIPPTSIASYNFKANSLVVRAQKCDDSTGSLKVSLYSGFKLVKSEFTSTPRKIISLSHSTSLIVSPKPNKTFNDCSTSIVGSAFTGPLQ
jgi:hypothetical protein